MVAKRMFEFVEGSSSKFWEVGLDGAKVMTRYGRVGTDGQSTVKDEGSVAAAQKLHDKLVGEKTRKGYREVGGAALVPAAPAAPAAPARKSKIAGKAGKPPKLPASLKVGTYADVLAASPELILAACTSGAETAAWSLDGGVTKIDRPLIDGLPFRCGPAAGGLAVLPGSRFVMASRSVNFDQRVVDSTVGVFGLDGAPVGKLISEPGWTYQAAAVSPDGTLVAVISSHDGKGRLSIWHLEDLVRGAAPQRVVAGPFTHALTFTADGKDVVFHEREKLTFVPVAAGAAREVKTACSVEGASIISAADGLICSSNGSDAALLTLAGKTVFDLPGPLFKEKRGLVVEHAMVAPDGTVIAAAGELGKHYASDFFTGVKLPDEAMGQGFVAALDAKGKVLTWQPRTKNKPVRAMALAVGLAVVVGQDGAAEIAPWPRG